MLWLALTLCGWMPAPTRAALDKQIVTVETIDGVILATFTDRADDAALEAAIPELVALGVQAVSLRGIHEELAKIAGRVDDPHR